MMPKTVHIATLPYAVQARIRNELERAGVEQEDVERGMNGRICDLEDTINLNWR